MLFAAISGSALVNAVIWIIVAALIYFVCMWGINAIGIPEPFHKIAVAILVVATVLLLVNGLLTLAGSPLIRWP